MNGWFLDTKILVWKIFYLFVLLFLKNCFFILDLEEKSKISGPKKMSMSDEDAGFCIYLMDKYGDNYKVSR